MRETTTPNVGDTPEKVGYAQKKRDKNKVKADERRRRERLGEVETLITILEEKLASLGKKLENPPSDAGKVKKLGEGYGNTEKQLEELLAEWERLAGS